MNIKNTLLQAFLLTALTVLPCTSGIVCLHGEEEGSLSLIVNGIGCGYTEPMSSGVWRSFPDSALKPLADATQKEFKLKGNAGGILSAWTTGTFDGKDTIYVRGGGHLAYEGNEIYSFNLSAGTWKRETKPGRAIPRTDASGKAIRHKYKAVYDDGTPSSAHHYAHLSWDQANGVLIMGPLLGYSNPPIVVRGIWEWDPKKPDNTIKGYRLTVPGINWNAIRISSTYDPVTKRTLIVGNGIIRLYNAKTDKIDGQAIGFPWKPGGTCLMLDPETRLVAIQQGPVGLCYTRYSVEGKFKKLTKFGGATVRDFMPKGVTGAMASRKGSVYMWNGARSVHVWKQESLPKPDFTELKNGASPKAPASPGHIYSTWWYLKKYDVFIGITANYAEPVWVYKPPEALPEKAENEHLDKHL